METNSRNGSEMLIDRAPSAWCSICSRAMAASWSPSSPDSLGHLFASPFARTWTTRVQRAWCSAHTAARSPRRQRHCSIRRCAKAKAVPRRKQAHCRRRRQPGRRRPVRGGSTPVPPPRCSSRAAPLFPPYRHHQRRQTSASELHRTDFEVISQAEPCAKNPFAGRPLGEDVLAEMHGPTSFFWASTGFDPNRSDDANLLENPAVNRGHGQCRQSACGGLRFHQFRAESGPHCAARRHPHIITRRPDLAQDLETLTRQAIEVIRVCASSRSTKKTARMNPCQAENHAGIFFDCGI